MKRPSFEQLYMQMAMLFAERSTCSRLKVGAVITSSDFRYVYGIGYNGSASGMPNKCSNVKGNCGDLHAEVNAIINCNTPRNFDKFMFVTHLPCPNCASMIINLGGVKKLYYHHSYRLKTSLKMLRQSGIIVKRT